MQRSETTIWERLALVIAGALFLATALIIAVKLPQGRGNDEDSHMTYVRYVADYRQLPDATKLDFGINREPHQPPLYYIGGSVWLRVARVIGLGQLSVRLYSTVIGLVWFWLVWLIARRLLPAGVRVLPNLALASFPMAAQLAGTVNNDILAITLTTAMFYAAVRVWQDNSPRWLLLAPVLGGAAILSKLFAGPAVAVISVALLIRAIRSRRVVPLLLGLGLGLVPILFFVANNLQLYGHVLPELALGSNPLVRAYYDAPTFWRVFPFIIVTWQTFVGKLGSWDVALPNWFYWTQAVAWLAAVVGLAWRRTLPITPTSRRLVFIGLIAFAACWIPYLYLNTLFFQPQARYIYPGLIAPLLVVAIGWAALAQRAFPRIRQPWLVPAATLLLLDVVGLFATLHAL